MQQNILKKSFNDVYEAQIEDVDGEVIRVKRHGVRSLFPPRVTLVVTAAVTVSTVRSIQLEHY